MASFKNENNTGTTFNQRNYSSSRRYNDPILYDDPTVNYEGFALSSFSNLNSSINTFGNKNAPILQGYFWLDPLYWLDPEFWTGMGAIGNFRNRTGQGSVFRNRVDIL